MVLGGCFHEKVQFIVFTTNYSRLIIAIECMLGFFAYSNCGPLSRYGISGAFLAIHVELYNFYKTLPRVYLIDFPSIDLNIAEGAYLLE